MGLLILGIALVNVAQSDLAHGTGGISFLAFIALGFRAALRVH